MKFFIGSALVAIAVVVTAAQTANNETKRRLTTSEVWDQYSDVFGSRVQSAITNTDTLQAIILNDVRSFSDSTSVAQVACATYENGSNLATYVRENPTALPPNSIVRPFHVSEDGDKMCFAIYSTEQLPSEIASLLSFKFSVPSSLKVESSVYDFVDFPDENAMPSSTTLTDMSVSFLMNATLASNNPELGNGEDLYRAAQSLNAYQTQVFETFFWSSSSTRAYFDKASATVSTMDADALRAYKWNSLASMFQSTLSIPDSSNGTAPADPCNFKAMKIEKHVDRIVMSLDAIQALPPSMQSACIAFMTASFSQQPGAWHITLLNAPEIFNFRARSITQTSTVGSDSYFVPYTRMGLQGQGQIVAVADTGADVESCFFYESNSANRASPSSIYSPTTNLKARKIVQYTYLPASGDKIDDVSGHGSHVLGSIIGNNPSADLYKDSTYDGVAPQAKGTMMDLGSGGSVAVPPATILYSPGRSAGARVHTNSWGSYNPSVRYYTAADTDQYLYDHMDMTIFFAAGNTGSDGARSVSLQAQAKNIISVGSSQTTYNSANIDYVSWFSSQGPAFDGRIKPEIVSPGDKIVSVNSNGGRGPSCSTIAKMGTSMASPTAAGNAILVRQYFTGTDNSIWTSMCNTNYAFCKRFTPSGVLVKAVMLHSGKQMQLYNGAAAGKSNVQLGRGPDNYQGYGRVNLLSVLPLSGYTAYDLFVDDLHEIVERHTNTYTVRIRNPSIPLKVTLSWYDPPSVTGTASTVLINNLDLTVISPSGSKSYGNGRSSADQINNNEQIYIPKPSVGDYQVRVSANSLPYAGSQKYAIVITSGGQVSV